MPFALHATAQAIFPLARGLPLSRPALPTQGIFVFARGLPFARLLLPAQEIFLLACGLTFARLALLEYVILLTGHLLLLPDLLFPRTVRQGFVFGCFCEVRLRSGETKRTPNLVECDVEFVVLSSFGSPPRLRTRLRGLLRLPALPTQRT